MSVRPKTAGGVQVNVDIVTELLKFEKRIESIDIATRLLKLEKLEKRIESLERSTHDSIVSTFDNGMEFLDKFAAVEDSIKKLEKRVDDNIKITQYIYERMDKNAEGIINIANTISRNKTKIRDIE